MWKDSDVGHEIHVIIETVKEWKTDVMKYILIMIIMCFN